MFWKSIKLYQAFEEKLGQSTIGYRFNQLNYYFHSIIFMKQNSGVDPGFFPVPGRLDINHSQQM